jgi:hypothetical protein
LANPAGAGLEQALDLSKNVLDQAKRDLGNSLLILDDLESSIQHQVSSIRLLKGQKVYQYLLKPWPKL